MSLLEGLYNKGYNLTLYTRPLSFFGYFITIKQMLMAHLEKRLVYQRIFGCGSQRKGKSTAVDQALMVCRWNDFYKNKSSKVVAMMSTKHVGLLQDSGRKHFATKRNIFGNYNPKKIEHTLSVLIFACTNFREFREFWSISRN